MLADHAPFALVADDDFLIRMDAAAILTEAGFRVREAANVAEAMAILETHGDSLQLLFTDVQMPPSEDTGFDLARRCAERWKHVSIVVASGQRTPGPGDMPVGAVFIAKPFSAQVVYDRLLEVLPDGAQPKPLRDAATDSGQT
jgi:DNA-binding NtrC family response regulator